MVKKLLKGGALLSFGQVLATACSFVRNIIIARVLTVEEFGIASTFAVTLSLVEMSAQLALDKYLIQHVKGAERGMIANAHSLMIVRGVILGAILLLVSWPMAYLFGLTDILWAFQLLAISPILRGFTHLHYAVEQRSYNVTPMTLIEVIPQVLATLMLWPLLILFPDYRAMLFVLLFMVLFVVVVSHIQATDRFEVKFDKAVQLEMLHFGWPLMINGLLMFGIFQGDRLLVGSGYGVEMLGLYSAAFSLLMLPSLVIHRIFNTYTLPTMARVKGQCDQFNRIAIYIVALGIGLGAFMGVSSLLFGEAALILVFGQKFSAAAGILHWLAIMQSVRLARIPASTIAMSMGDTRNEMYSNMVRSVALLLGLAAIYYRAPVISIAIAGVIGELFAIAVSYFMIRRCLVSFSSARFVAMAGIFVSVLAATLFYEAFIEFGWIKNIAMLIALTSLIIISIALLVPNGKAYIQRRLLDHF